MNQLAVWQITQGAPEKLSRAEVDLEKSLEDWIEEDPSLLQEGLTIVGRQLAITGGRLDLLAVDPQGRWVVIEIKAGQVRRDTVAQVVDYASSLAIMPWSSLRSRVEDYLARHTSGGRRTLHDLGIQEDEAPRDVWMYVVGTGRHPGLERMVGYLSDAYNVPISVVSYDVFRIADGEQLMVRELMEGEGTEKEPASTSPSFRTIQELRATAQQQGIGQAFDVLSEAASHHEFYARPYKRSVMFTPPQNKTRMLFTIRVHADSQGNLPLYMWAGAFPEFYDVSEEHASALMGDRGWRSMTLGDTQQLVAKIGQLLGTEGL